MPDDVQDYTQQSQGDQGGGTGIFDSYLQAVPEDGREAVTGYLRDAERHVNERIQTAAELEKQWSPYAGLELPPPEQLSELLQWSNQTLQNQETFDAWVTQIAEEKGLTKAETEEELGIDDQAQGLSEQRVQELIEARTQEGVSSLEERLQEMETTQAVELETDAINRSLSELEKEANVKLSENQREAVLRLGMAHAYDNRGNELPAGDTSWVPKGFEEYRSIGADAQRTFIEDASRQPASAMTTGSSAKMQPVTTFDEAKAALKERFKQMQT